MKVAILTLPLYTNYGGILQCYALQTVLEKMHHEVRVLAKPVYGRSYPLVKSIGICVRLLQRYGLRKDVPIWNADYELIRIPTDRFIHRYIHLFVRRNWTQKIADRFDAVVVGSDQVWRPGYYRRGYAVADAFLAFAADRPIKRIAYAASFGVDSCEFTPEQLRICAPLLRGFDAVSVREFSGLELCRTYFGAEACQMVDPTLLLDAEDYIRLIEQTETKPIEGDLLAYFLDETLEKAKILESVASINHYHPFSVGSRVDDPAAPLDERIQIPVEQWLRGFRDAKMVVTDSFHGCVFSMLFQKPFIAIGNAARGLTRFTSLLGLLGLGSRLILSMKEFQSRREELSSPIDYSTVNARLRTCREEAAAFLKQALES